MQKCTPKMAKELKKFVEAYRYEEWIAYVTQAFDFKNFMRGLEWFVNSGCGGCLQSGGMPNCEVRNCCIEKSLKNCYFCKDFLKCKKLAYQKETYRISENYDRIKRIGYEKWLKEQEEKLREDFDNIYFLEKKLLSECFNEK
jgi:hypothetical protein